MNSHRATRQVSSASSTRLLLLYGVFAVVTGSVEFVQGGQALVGYGGPLESVERSFIGHIVQAHAGSMIGLGVIALGLARRRESVLPVHRALFIVNLLLLVVELLTAPPGERGLVFAASVVMHLLFAVAFGYVALQTLPEPETEASNETSSSPRAATIISFATLVMASGIVWLLAPARLAAMASGETAGAVAIYVGQIRGAADLAIGLIAWAARSARRTPFGRAVIVGLCISNLLLATTGLLAQLSVLSTPARWLVEGLHVFWALAFAGFWHSDASMSRSAQ